MTTAIAELADAFRGQMNKHDLAITLIHACIDQGINTHGRIVETLVRLGFDNQHVAIMVRTHCGNSSERHHWRKDGDQYANHEGCCS